MTEQTPRAPGERKADVLAMLRARYAEVWVASASREGAPHLVPLSLAWDDVTVILSVGRRSLTARNIVDTGRARLALGQTGDVVMIDAALRESIPLDRVPPELAETFARQADWDPRRATGLPGARGRDYVYLCLSPRRIQAWRSEAEHQGRTIMREGRWLV